MADLRDLLKNGINDEALRRMARRAGVQATSQKETDHVNNALRGIGYHILENICAKLAIYTQHREAKTVTQADFRAACDQLKIKLSIYAVPNENNTFEKCRKYSPGARATKRTRGELAEREKQHEQKRENCVYNESAPFVRLVRDVMSEVDMGRDVMSEGSGRDRAEAKAKAKGSGRGGDLGAVGENLRQESPSANYNPCTTLWTKKKQRIKGCLQPSTQRTKVMPKK